MVCTILMVTDFQVLKEKSHSKPFETYRLSFCVLDSTKKIILTFGSQKEPMLNEYSLRLHFESFTGKGSVEKVELLPPNKANVIFKDPRSKLIIAVTGTLHKQLILPVLL